MQPPRSLLPSRRHLVALVAVVAVLASACGAATRTTTVSADMAAAATGYDPVGDGPTVRGVRDRAAIQAVLDTAAAAFLAGDDEAVRDVLLDPSSPFGRRWQDRAQNLVAVPLAAYRLTLDPSLPDLATDRVRARHDRPVQVVYVVEEHALTGFDDTGPAAEDLFLTVVETPDGWRIAGDRDAEPLGLVSVDHLWDHGPVTATVDGPLLALHHPGTVEVAAVLADARVALEQTRDRWPLSWPGRVPIVVPRDQDELGELLHVTFDLSNFIAFATATPVTVPGGYRLSGSRVVLNPERFFDRTTATRRSILVHELLHVATRPVAGPMVPSWLEEGVAQALGEQRSTTGTRLLEALLADGRELPADGEFTVGGRDRIFLSYQLSWSFVEHLRRRFGRDAVARFYAEVGRGGVTGAGTEAWNVDRAAREVLDEPLEVLVERWRRGG